MNSYRHLPVWVYGVIVSLLVAIGGLVFWFAGEIDAGRQELASTTAALNLKISQLEAGLASTTAEKDRFFAELSEEQKQTLELEDRIRTAHREINTLTKLTETDPELLQKYSKVFFLSENYVPKNLSNISEQYLYNKNKPQKVASEILPFLEQMLKDASDSDAPLTVVSGYRSFDEQSSLKSIYTTTYGSGANKFSADQGYSEHQLGLTVDLTTTGVLPTTAAFANTRAYLWLTNNAHRYGFVLSYPKGNAYYIYEPWHWRFVGRELASLLHDEKKNFYDLDQRELDEYLIKIFD